MISWRDSLALSRKRWKRKRIFGSLKYSGPLFLLTLLTIITLNICYIVLERLREISIDRHPSHLMVKVPSKSNNVITPAQVKSLKEHPAVRQSMAGLTWVSNFYADLGEVRYAPLSDICGYTKDFFDLYRTLPLEKSDPTCVPVLMGRDLLSLTWSPEQRRFVRNEKAEMRRWLGRTFTVYMNPWGMETYEPKFAAEHLDYKRYNKSVLDKRRLNLADLELTNPDLARQQDAVFVKMQVVGFVRDITVVTFEIAEQMIDLSALRRGKKRKQPADYELKSVNLLIIPGHKQEVTAFANSLGLEVFDNSKGIFSTLYKGIKDDPGLRLAVYVIISLYSLAMMVIIYQLLSGQVKDSIREIGLLRCIGARRRDIMRIFIVMNLVRLTRIYLACLVAAYALLLGFGYWLAGMLNVIDPENLIKENIPDFLINRIDHFTPFWMMGPPWMVVMPLLFLLPIAFGSAIVPIWHVMGVQPSEALKD